MGPEVIVGYLVAQLVGAGARFADKQVDGLLQALANRVWQRLGADDPALLGLRTTPLDEDAQRRAQAALARAADEDPNFHADLAALQGDLDERGARQLVLHAPGAETVIGLNYGVVVREGFVHVDQRPVNPADLSHDPAWVRWTFVLGMGLFMVGFGLFGWALFTSDLTATPAGTAPPGLALAAAVVFCGLLLLALSQVGHSVSGPSRAARGRAQGPLPQPSAGPGGTRPRRPPDRPVEDGPIASPPRRGFALAAVCTATGLVAGTFLGMALADSGGIMDVAGVSAAVEGRDGVAGVVVGEGWNLRATPDGEWIGTVLPGDYVVVACASGRWARLLEPRAGAYVWAEGLRLDGTPPAC